MIVGALVLPRTSVGITEASTTRSPSMPRTRSCGSTTACRRRCPSGRSRPGGTATRGCPGPSRAGRRGRARCRRATTRRPAPRPAVRPTAISRAFSTPLDQRVEVALVGEVAGVDGRRPRRVGRPQPHRAAASCTRTSTAAAVKASTSGSTSACFQNLTGRKWYCRSGSGSSGRDRVNSPASARLRGQRAAPGAEPLRVARRRLGAGTATCPTGRARRPARSGWSCRPCADTGQVVDDVDADLAQVRRPGRCPRASAAAGMLIAPPESTTSRAARTVCTSPAARGTPRRSPGRPRRSTRVVSAPVRTVRFGRPLAGCR